jgi:hypothetical protein
MNSSATAHTDLRRVTDKNVIELIHADEPSVFPVDELAQCMKLLRKDHGSTVFLIKRLMNTGTPTARRLVAKVMRKALTQLAEAHQNADQDEHWIYGCDWVWNRGLHPMILRAWNTGNVIEETGGTIEDDAATAAVDSALHGVKSSGVPFAPDESSSTYWRGLTAFALCKVVYRNSKDLRQRAQSRARFDFYATVGEFIDWAGKHPDISTVITTAKERRTISVMTLDRIIREANAAPSAESGAA